MRRELREYHLARGNRTTTSIMLNATERARAERLRLIRGAGSLGALIRELLLEDDVRQSSSPPGVGGDHSPAGSDRDESTRADCTADGGTSRPAADSD